jgi:hypothetical protein
VAAAISFCPCFFPSELWGILISTWVGVGHVTPWATEMILGLLSAGAEILGCLEQLLCVVGKEITTSYKLGREHVL